MHTGMNRASFSYANPLFSLPLSFGSSLPLLEANKASSLSGSQGYFNAFKKDVGAVQFGAGWSPVGVHRLNVVA